MKKKEQKRYTLSNHAQGERHRFRIPMDYAGELTFYGEKGVLWMSGDLVDRLGDLEDQEEKEK